MSEHGVHVHAPHDHAVEHQAQAGDRLSQYISIFTAILATVGAVIGYHVATTLNQSIMLKNEAVLKKTEASDQWNFYQAKSTKGALTELAANITAGDKAARYRKEAERYGQEKQDIKKQAEALEQQSLAANEQSSHLLHPLHRSEQAMALIQIAIALASITALTRRRWLFGVAGAAAAIGVGLALWGALGT